MYVIRYLFQVVINYLWFNRTLARSAEEPRFHHQLMPMYIRIDKDLVVTKLDTPKSDYRESTGTEWLVLGLVWG